MGGGGGGGGGGWAGGGGGGGGLPATTVLSWTANRIEPTMRGFGKCKRASTFPLSAWKKHDLKAVITAYTLQRLENEVDLVCADLAPQAVDCLEGEWQRVVNEDGTVTTHTLPELFPVVKIVSERACAAAVAAGKAMDERPGGRAGGPTRWTHGTKSVADSIVEDVSWVTRGADAAAVEERVNDVVDRAYRQFGRTVKLAALREARDLVEEALGDDFDPSSPWVGALETVERLVEEEWDDDEILVESDEEEESEEESEEEEHCE